MTSNFISKLISHHVANDPEIPVLNVIQKVQVLLQTGCTYKRTWYARKFAIKRVFSSRETTFLIQRGHGMHEDFWRDAPYNLTFYPPNMNNQQGRKQGTRL
ncbi:hypothetical protein M9H77_18031 [Catharanthus roseus]|uniref:Uncharacterized protein n=1 Tax=Catharanthus roseus TaxID=4058 RepID=A0ACC0B6A8_CATRO|nr:hypothetical protein M9H77_18031 [Catharanthus roseus]